MTQTIRTNTNKTTTIILIYLLTATIFLAGSLQAATYKTIRVKYGDTLGNLAGRYKTSVSRLKRINGMKSNRLTAGQRLKVPRSKSGKRSLNTSKRRAVSSRPRVYRVRGGDTLSKIAKRYGLQTASLARWNYMRKNATLRTGSRLRLFPPGSADVASKGDITVWKNFYQGSKVLLPGDWKPPTPQKKSFQGKEYSIYLYAQNFQRGHAAYMEIIPRQNVTAIPRVTFQDKKVPVTRRPWGYRALIGFSAYQKGGLKKLKIEGKTGGQIFTLNISDKYYPLKVWKKYLGNYDKASTLSAEVKARRQKARQERLALIRESNRIKKKVFAQRSTDKLTARTAYPRTLHRVTSTFFNNRKRVHYYRKGGKVHYNKPYFTRHTGLDLAGRNGAPIFALARGKVVVARKMYYEGNFTVIDHGNGVFSGYMHQSSFKAREGELVKAGDLVGRVGSTGRVTGPHLHVSLKVRGKYVHPLSIVGLPIR